MRALLASLLLTACGAEPPDPASTATPATATPATATPATVTPATVTPSAPPPTAAAPPLAADPCEVHRAAFRAALAAATGRCASDAECGCFAPVVEEAGCGGITDSATAARLGVIQADYFGAGCHWPRACAPWACEPTCRAGRCENGSAGGLIGP